MELDSWIQMLTYYVPLGIELPLGMVINLSKLSNLIISSP